MRDGSVPPCTGDDQWPFPAFGEGQQVAIVGRVKIVLPKYRVRGICSIWGEGERIVIEFEHSSLFGAYRENAKIVIDGHGMTIIDRERGVSYGTEKSLSLLRDEIAFDLHPDDIAYALLLAVPSCSAIEGLKAESADGGWRLAGVWRGRNIEMEGRSGFGPDRLVLCADDDIDCYTISYKRDGGRSYPRRLEMARKGGEERIFLEVIDFEYRQPPGGNLMPPERGANMELFDLARVSFK